MLEREIDPSAEYAPRPNDSTSQPVIESNPRVLEAEVGPSTQGVQNPETAATPIEELRARLEEEYPKYKQAIESYKEPQAELSVEGKTLQELEQQLQMLEAKEQKNLEGQVDAARELERATKVYWEKVDASAKEIEILLAAKKDVLKIHGPLNPWKISEGIDYLKAADDLDDQLHRARINYARLGQHGEFFVGKRDRLYQTMHYLNDELDRLRAQIAGHKAAIQALPR